MLMWQIEQPKDPMSWVEAVEYCRNLRLDGYTDWRLPTIMELKSLVDYNLCEPATSMPNIVQSFYWSYTTHAKYTKYAWGVYFLDGNDDYYYKLDNGHVRAVRVGVT
jgi:hypothetical protein